LALPEKKGVLEYWSVGNPVEFITLITQFEAKAVNFGMCEIRNIMILQAKILGGGFESQINMVRKI